jgi:hypothetical protein
MSLSLPKTLIPNTPENVSDAQANFDALATAVNNVLGDVTGSLDNLSVDKVTKQQTRVGLGGTVESTSVTKSSCARTSILPRAT